MSVPSLRPRVCDLAFQVYGRPLHPELFDILAVRKIQREDWELVVRITRTGHVIAWGNNSVYLTEVAGGDQSLPDRRLLNYRLRGERSDRVRTGRGVSYQTSFQVEVLPSEIFTHVHDEILADGSKRGLLHNFRTHNRLALSPLGFVTAEGRPGCLIISAFHTFPDEFTIVKTQTLIEKKV